MKKAIAIFGFLLLVVAHQDFWWWHTHEPLVFGFIPVGLAWHAGISICAACLGAFAVRFCWPRDLEQSVDDHVSNSPSTRLDGQEHA
ncbi:MAG: hypothetical protein KF841_05690 [Phycisphaerae bacterium]|nr:hypothetical protein [Phycisphaerae bacterium]